MNNQVRAAQIVGDEIYIGGYFTAIGEEERWRGAAYDLTTDMLTDFNPKFNSNVETVKSDGTNILFGGPFTLST